MELKMYGDVNEDLRNWISEMVLWERDSTDLALNSPWTEEEGDGGVRESAEMLSLVSSSGF